MKIKSARFERSAPNLAACPPPGAPEFAFIGRSNVGKSSLINCLAQRKELALVSATPGKTRLLNFFRINEAWLLVDLPGYGFAKTAKEQRADFNEAVADYLEHRDSLACTFVLIDSRLPPQEIDLQFLRWLAETGCPFVLVFTKTDQQPSKVQANIAQFTRTLADAGVAAPRVFRCSAHTGKGRDELLRFIGDLLEGRATPDAAPGAASAPPETPAEDDYEDPNDWDKIS